MSILGIYGGTFSPPHIGHIYAASAFLEQIRPDKLLIMPAYLSPNKSSESTVSAVDRYNMAVLAFSDLRQYGKSLFVSDWEIKRPEKSYTYKTIEHFEKDADEIYLVIGTDMLLTFDKWKNVDRICSSARLAYVSRTDDDSAANEKIRALQANYGADVVRVTVPPLPCDSTHIREVLSRGGRPYGVTEKVYEYVVRNRLYMNDGIN